jgi:hypothetical protein
MREKDSKVKVSGVFLDLGISSPQFDDKSRGFRPEQDGPLDLRFDVTSGVSAYDFLLKVSRNDLRDIIFKYGETNDKLSAQRIADAIVLARDTNALPKTTKAFATLVANALVVFGSALVSRAKTMASAMRCADSLSFVSPYLNIISRKSFRETFRRKSYALTPLVTSNRKSRGPSCSGRNPRDLSSNCGEEMPKSRKTPETFTFESFSRITLHMLPNGEWCM